MPVFRLSRAMSIRNRMDIVDRMHARGIAWRAAAPVNVVLWGKNSDSPFFQARDIEPREVRAMTLLEGLCDRERFLIYATYGQLPVRGSLTGKTYLIRRHRQVLEFDNGKAIASLCIHIDPKFPQTDNVVVLKNMIEGEEGRFLGTANRSVMIFDPGQLPPIPHLVGL